MCPRASPAFLRCATALSYDDTVAHSAAPPFSAIVTSDAPPDRVRACVESLRAAGIEDVTVVVGGESADVVAPGARVLDLGRAPFPVALNAAVRQTTGEVVLLVAPVVRVEPTLLDRFRDALRTRDDVAVVHSDYTVLRDGKAPVVQRLHTDPTDLSEWSTFGYVRGVRRSAWLSVGGYDESYRLAEDYDLRLRLGVRWRFVRVPEPLYAVAFPIEPADVRRYFTPESSRVPGFGYLFMDAELAREVDRAFEAAVRSRGAFLEHENPPVECPHSGTIPAVSVVIPTFERAGLLRRAITSVVGGAFSDFEVIVVDNGSRDGTRELVEELSGADPRIRLLINAGRPSIASALNLGIRAARGRYVSQLDSDDEYVPGTLAEQVAELDRHPRWGLAVSYYEVIDEEGRVAGDFGPIRHLEYDRNAILRTAGVGCVRTWHRCVLERLGGFDEDVFGSYSEDYDLALRMSERFDVGRVHSVLYRCRRHATNTERRLDLEFRAELKIEARRRALERRRTLCEEHRRRHEAG